MPDMFLLVDEYLGLRLGAEIGRLEPGHPLVVESTRRLRCEPSYGFVHALWAVAFGDGRCIVSVPPGAGAEVQELWAGATALEPMDDQRLAGHIRRAVNQSLMTNGLDSQDGEAQTSLLFACNAALLQRHALASCCRLTGDSISAAEGVWLPDYCFPGGIVYGVIEDVSVVSIAYAHRTELMKDRVADIGVETAPAYRRRQGLRLRSARLKPGADPARRRRRLSAPRAGGENGA
jgi:hypothetical protein